MLGLVVLCPQLRTSPKSMVIGVQELWRFGRNRKAFSFKNRQTGLSFKRNRYARFWGVITPKQAASTGRNIVLLTLWSGSLGYVQATRLKTQESACFDFITFPITKVSELHQRAR